MENLTIAPKRKYNYTKKTGRPSSYRPEYCKQIIEYFTQEPYQEVVTQRITTKSGSDIENFGLRANPPKFMEDFAFMIGVPHNRLLEWCKQFPEFQESYTRARQMQQSHWVINASMNNFNAQFSMFVLRTQFGWKDPIDMRHGLDEESTELMKKYGTGNVKEFKNRLHEVLSTN